MELSASAPQKNLPISLSIFVGTADRTPKRVKPAKPHSRLPRTATALGRNSRGGGAVAANLSLPLSLCRSSTDEAGEGGRNVDMGEKYARDARSRRNEGLGKQEEGMRRRHRGGFRDGTLGIANGIQDRLDEQPRRSERQDLTHLMPKCKRTTNSDYHDHHVFKPSSSCPRI